jgi:hypothetical protein
MKAVHAPGLANKLFSDEINGVDPITSVQPGEFEVTTEPSGQRRFWFVCPGPCRGIAAIALRPVIDRHTKQSWEFDGNMEAPTLEPSINHVGCWHGWLRSGVFTSC